MTRASWAPGVRRGYMCLRVCLCVRVPARTCLQGLFPKHWMHTWPGVTLAGTQPSVGGAGGTGVSQGSGRGEDASPGGTGEPRFPQPVEPTWGQEPGRPGPPVLAATLRRELGQTGEGQGGSLRSPNWGPGFTGAHVGPNVRFVPFTICNYFLKQICPQWSPVGAGNRSRSCF